MRRYITNNIPEMKKRMARSKDFSYEIHWRHKTGSVLDLYSNIQNNSRRI